MRILLLGYSSIAQRRILPALRTLGIADADIASRSRMQGVPRSRGRVFSKYEEAIETSDATLVYVSTVNSLHASLALHALERGKHVIVDKPAALHADDVLHLVRIAREKQLVLAEANVWGSHPQIRGAQQRFEPPSAPALRLFATFTFPLLPPDNYRHRAALGGGVIRDLGPYAISSGRHFFGDAPDEIVVRAIQPAESEVDVAFAILARYPRDRMLIGHFATGSPYSNRLEIQSETVSVTISPAFTTPADAPCVLDVVEAGQSRKVTVEAADSFARFIASVCDAIDRGDTNTHSGIMLADAAVMRRLVEAASIPHSLA